MKIRFSSDYPKLHGQTSAKLLEVKQITIDEDTPKELLDYDTTMTDGSKFFLSNGEYLQLILIGNFMIPFCTLRRCTYENVQKYVPNIGKTFELAVKKEANFLNRPTLIRGLYTQSDESKSAVSGFQNAGIIADPPGVILV